MRIPLHHITPDGYRLQGALPDELQAVLGDSLRLPARPLGGAMALVLHRHGARVLLRGEVRLVGELPCSACLQPAELLREVPLDVAIVPLSDLPAPLEGGELTEEAVEQYAYDHDVVDLTRVLHDEIVMELPLRLLCHEECRGLCAACGRNQNELGGPCGCQASKPSGPFAALANFRRPDAGAKA